jgi:DNA-binding GntR family transcriptional regulator
VPPRSQRSLREQVTTAIREAIVHGVLAPGERLREEDLAEELDMSRGPIREAMRQLEQEGLITSYPYRGTAVAEISTQEVLEVLSPIRATLERFALGSVFEDLTEDDFAGFAAVVDEMAIAAAESNLSRVVEVDLAFHRLLVQRSGHFHSLQIWDMIAPRMRVVFFRMGPAHTSLKTIADQHRRLLADLQSGDLELAKDSLAEHIAEPQLYGKLARKPASRKKAPAKLR